MKKITITCFAIMLIFCTSPVLADDLSELKKGLKAFQPISVEKNKDTYRIVMDERKVTQAIYENVIMSAVCSPIYLKKNINFLSSTKGLEVLNKFKKQGFVLEEPNVYCKEAAHISNKIQSDVTLYGRTHMFLKISI